MNCKADVEPGDGKFFAEVFVCSSCHTQAEHFFLRLSKELQYLLMMAKESIRITLVQGKFSFPEGPAGEASKRAVLEEIMKMEESRAAHLKEQQACSTPASSTPYSETTPPHVRTLARLGVEASVSSVKDSPQD